MSDVKSIINKNKEAAVVPDGIAVISKEHKIIVFNEAASRITGYKEDEIIGNDIKMLFEEGSEEIAFLNKALLEGVVFVNLSVIIKKFTGVANNVLASITPIKSNGDVVSVVFVFRDTKEMLTMADRIEEKTNELITQKNKLDAIFNSNIEGTFTIDDEWNITSFNKSAEKITGVKSKDAIGKKCRDVFNSVLCGNGCHMEETLLKGKSTIGNELEIERKTGEKIPIRVNTAVLIDNENKKIGAVETFVDISEIRNLSAQINEKYRFNNIVGNSKSLQQTISILESVSQTDSTVLITGESGTGKELAARSIHVNSNRVKGPFIAVNCSAFVESLIESELFGHEEGAFTGAFKTKTGRFEMAKGGTLFLDEIGDLTYAVQTKLLRVIENLEFEKVGGNKTIKIDTRIIAATNKDLAKEILEGRFREDLYYRINVINVHIPPLRERKEDLPQLINYFIEKFNKKFRKNIKQFSSLAYDVLYDYKWPGNIRELENVIEHCFVLCRSDVVQIDELPRRIREKDVLKMEAIKNSSTIKEAEKEVILLTLKKNLGNRKKSAKDLGIDTSTLWRKIKKYSI